MRIIHTLDYNEHTMVLGMPIYDDKGRILLAAGRSIHPNILKRLKSIGISYIFVDDAQSKGITLKEMIDMPTWMDAILLLKNIYKKITEKKHSFPLQDIQNIVHKLINELKQRQVIVLIPSTFTSSELRIYAHSVNVAILSLLTGKRLGYNELNLRDLAIGALLHDIGKAVTDDAKKHPEEGFNILRSNHEIRLLSSHIAFQHHESIDGLGYPRGLKGKKFLQYAQVCGLANFYENLVYKKDIPPHEAIEAVMALSGISYDKSVIYAFVHSNPSYPPGTLVKLNKGEKAIVTRIKSHMQRPIVRIISSKEEIILADNPTVLITGTVNVQKELNIV